VTDRATRPFNCRLFNSPFDTSLPTSRITCFAGANHRVEWARRDLLFLLPRLAPGDFFKEKRMPMTVNIGLYRKVGEANYGSRGATINIGMELDSCSVSPQMAHVVV